MKKDLLGKLTQAVETRVFSLLIVVIKHEKQKHIDIVVLCEFTVVSMPACVARQRNGNILFCPFKNFKPTY